MTSIHEEAPSDADLVAHVRNGDEEASGELFRRHHDAALGFAVKLAGATLAPDLVSEAFAKVFAAVRRGDGPDVSFRPYLLTTVRRTHVDHLRRTRREVPVDMMEDFAGGQAGLVLVDDPDARFEGTAVLRAFRSLPERWQTALWLAVVENEPLERVAHHLGMNANSVAALSFRAREGLRRAYLAEHLGRAEDPDCRATLEHLAQRVRGKLPRRRDHQVAQHLDECLLCTGALAELETINTNLGAVLVPALLGGGLSADALAGFGVGAAAGARRWGRALSVAGATALVVLLGAWWMASGDPAESPEPVRNEALASDVPAATATPLATPPAMPSAAPSVDDEEENPEPVVEPPAGTPSAPVTIPAEATESLSLTPTPAPQPTRTPETPVSEPLVLDVGLGEGSQHQLTFVDPIWVHVELPIVSRGTELTLVVRLTDVAGHRVHADRDYGGWRCVEQARVGEAQTLVCHLTPVTGRSDTFGLDLHLDPDSSASVAARVRPTDGQDPRPEDNVARLTVSVADDPPTTPRRVKAPSGRPLA